MFAVKKSKLAAIVVVAAAALAGAGTAQADSIIFSNGYLVNNPNVTCETDFDANGNLAKRSIHVGTPTMSSPISNQQTSYQPILTRWNGSAWVSVVAYPEVFGSTAAQMPDNYGFNVQLTGAYYWRVSIVYRWYYNGSVTRKQHVWAGTHQLLFMRDGYSPLWGAAGSHCLLSVTRAN